MRSVPKWQPSSRGAWASISLGEMCIRQMTAVHSVGPVIASAVEDAAHHGRSYRNFAYQSCVRVQIVEHHNVR